MPELHCSRKNIIFNSGEVGSKILEKQLSYIYFSQILVTTQGSPMIADLSLSLSSSPFIFYLESLFL